MSAKFNATKEESKVIRAIAHRAKALAAKHGADLPVLEAVMDIEATHSNGCPLKLEALLEADDFNFSHDVFGIRRHIDRETGRLGNHFLPRFHA